MNLRAAIGRLSIRSRIQIYSVVLLVLLASLMSGIIWEVSNDLLHKQLESLGQETAFHVASKSATLIMAEDYYSLGEEVRQSAQTSHYIRYIFISDTSGRILAHTFDGGVPSALIERARQTQPSESPQSRQLTSNEGRLLEMTAPIEQGSLGSVHVGLSTSAARQYLAGKLAEVVLLTVLVCFVAALASGRIAKAITAPLQRLSVVADKIAAGQWQKQASCGGAPEVERLTTAFNAMTGTLTRNLDERERLLLELQQKEAVRAHLMERLLRAQEDERRRISRELHDETGQALASLMVTMRMLAEETDDPTYREVLLRSRDVAEGVLLGIRNLAVELRPPVLDDIGLIAALRRHLERLCTPLSLQWTLESEQEEWNLRSDVAVALYRIVQEGVTNIIRHAQAASLHLSFHQQNDWLCIELADDGRGVTEKQVAETERLGIQGMRERVELLGGRFTLSPAAGQGTLLRVEIPLTKETPL